MPQLSRMVQRAAAPQQACFRFLSAAIGVETFIERLHGIKTVASTIPANGDVNPYALLVAPVSAGKIVKGDLLVDNFNDKGNDQGTGSTIVQVTPQGKVALFTEISRTLAGCPRGVGLTTAMTVLANGDVIVGSAPSTDGLGWTESVRRMSVSRAA